MSLGVTSSCTILRIQDFNSLIPAPVAAETRTIGAFSIMVPASLPLISSSIISSQSSSTRSHLFSTRTVLLTPRSSRISRCSLVCGMMPSSAATTIKTRSMPTTPATILPMNFSCPGTSTIPALVPSSISNQVKPRSIVMPLFCSSFRRSVFLPVSARIRVVFP